MTSSLLRYDLLRTRAGRFLLRSPAFPIALQAMALAGVITLIGVGVGIGADRPAVELMTLRKTNLSTLGIWGLWWPGMIAVAVTFGRAWCTVCPMELVNRVGNTLARTVGWPTAHLSRFLRTGWMIVLIYLALQLLVAGLSIHRVPHLTAVFLMVLLGGAFATGLVFREQRSFCKAFCPAGALLSVYGRSTPFQLEMRDPAVCARCLTKDCVRAEHRHRFDRRSCPSLLRPFDRTASDGCVLCLQCAKVCPHDNVGVGLVALRAPIRRRVLLRPFEAAFVMVALGFVSHEVVGEVAWLEAGFHFVPTAMSAYVPFVSFGWLEALWFLALFPMAVWVVIAAFAQVLGHRQGLRSVLLAAATGAAPVVAIAHLAKAAAKVAAWGGFLPLALRDPYGAGTAQRLGDHALAYPPELLSLRVVGWAVLPVLALVAWRAWRCRRELASDAVPGVAAGALGASLLFSTVLTIWSWSGP